ncbi:MAG: PH domain-containing protein [Candidatus Micrarchaeota archaeon]|nr:PH domain-containing protein [Candidatus Micrarchaeota archaeon]
MPYDLKHNATSFDIRLSRKKVIKKTLAATIFLIMTYLLALAVYLFYPDIISQTLSPLIVIDNIIIILAITFVIFLAMTLNILYHYIYYKTYYFNIKEDVLVIRKGVFMPDEISIPYNRIQDIYVNRDFLDLILGLYDVHVSSATAESALDAHIDGVTHKNAVKLKEMVLDKVKKSSKEKTPL